MIQVINDIEKLLGVKDDWQRIWKNCKNASPFQTFDYVIASINAFNEIDSLYVLLVKDRKGVARAILPTKIDRNGRLSFINERHSDFCDIIVETEYDDFNLYKELSQFILSTKQIKMVCFENLKRESLLISSFKPFVSTCFMQDCNYYSVIPIFPKSTDKDFVDAFSFVASKRKWKLRKQYEATVQGADFRIYEKTKGDVYPEDVIKALIESMVTKGYRTKAYFSENMLEFWKELYESGLLICAVLKKGNVFLACTFMFYDSKNNEYIEWIMLYEEGQYNLAINLETSNCIHKSGGAYMNFARGIYDYKIANFHPFVYPLFRLIITKSIGQHIKALCSLMLYNAKTVLKQYLKK